MPRRLLAPNRLGYRGASLLAYGLIFFITGLPLLLGIFRFAPVDHPTSIGIPIWAAGFVVAGILAIVSAFRHSPAVDKIGFATLLAVGDSWVAFCVFLQIWHLFNPHIPTLGWISIIGNTVIMIKIWVDSGWNEPIEPVNLAEKMNQ